MQPSASMSILSRYLKNNVFPFHIGRTRIFWYNENYQHILKKNHFMKKMIPFLIEISLGLLFIVFVSQQNLWAVLQQKPVLIPFLIIMTLWRWLEILQAGSPYPYINQQEDGEKLDKGFSLFVLTSSLWVVLLSSLFEFLSLSHPLITFPLPVQWLGFGLMSGGVILQQIAIQTLGDFYTFGLLIRRKHTLITHGIYNVIRHPGYLANTLISLGMAFALSSFLGLLFTFIVGIPARLYRIHKEELILQKEFGVQGTVYLQTVKKFIPYIY